MFVILLLKIFGDIPLMYQSIIVKICKDKLSLLM